jgi:hypothetical protein
MKPSTIKNNFVSKRSAKVQGKVKRVLQTKLTKHWRDAGGVVPTLSAPSRLPPRMAQALITLPNKLNLSLALAGNAVALLSINRNL